MNERGTLIVSRHWHQRSSELSFAIRSIAGAVSRGGPVAVLAPGATGHGEADGAFDLVDMGVEGDLRWPRAVPPAGTVVVDDMTPEIAGLLSGSGAGRVLWLAGPERDDGAAGQRLHLVDDGSNPPTSVDVHVPVNPLAERHRHHGFGFTGYQLVLSGPAEPGADLPPAAAWLSAAFPGADVLVVADAVASAWKGRALRGRATVDTRMDLWRLLAHAEVCIDLAPGPHIARECIEALRFGTPIIVPALSGPATVHARSGGGFTYAGPDELLAAAERMRNDGERAAASAAGRRYADARFGDAGALVERMRLLTAG